MNRPEASDGFAADIRCELLIMIPVGARRIGVACRVFCSHVKDAQAGTLMSGSLKSRRSDLKW
jgi:hypothetical protein